VEEARFCGRKQNSMEEGKILWKKQDSVRKQDSVEEARFCEGSKIL
jgi:hypothetical protein